ncbi:hypothetical protein [Pseudomonas sp. SDO55104_S430]
MSDLDAHNPFAGLNLPPAVQAQALKLWQSILRATTVSDTLHALDRAEGFVLGLETLKGLNTASLEGLYLAFDGAAQARQMQLGVRR